MRYWRGRWNRSGRIVTAETGSYNHEWVVLLASSAPRYASRSQQAQGHIALHPARHRPALSGLQRNHATWLVSAKPGIALVGGANKLSEPAVVAPRQIRSPLLSSCQSSSPSQSPASLVSLPQAAFLRTVHKSSNTGCRQKPTRPSWSRYRPLHRPSRPSRSTMRKISSSSRTLWTRWIRFLQS